MKLFFLKRRKNRHMLGDRRPYTFLASGDCGFSQTLIVDTPTSDNQFLIRRLIKDFEIFS